MIGKEAKMGNVAEQEAIIAAGYDTLDFSVLPFAMDDHWNGLAAMARMRLQKESILPTLRARNVVLVQMPSANFRIERTNGEDTDEESGQDAGDIVREVI